MPQGKKKEKKIYIGKEEIIPTLFTEDIIIYVENPMTSTPPKKTLELISLSRVQDIRSIYKNHLYFQILTTIRNLNIKNTIYNSFKQYKIFSDKSDKICAISLHRNYKVWLRKGKKKQRNQSGTSLVAQWLRICLPMQGTRVWALVREDPTCRGATKPVCHNYWACALEPKCHNYWEKPLQWEAHKLQWRVAPLAATRESLCTAMKTEHSQK